MLRACLSGPKDGKDQLLIIVWLIRTLEMWCTSDLLMFEQVQSLLSGQSRVSRHMQVDLHYNGFCNSVLWQLFHYVPLNMDSKLSETRTLQVN